MGKFRDAYETVVATLEKSDLPKPFVEVFSLQDVLHEPGTYVFTFSSQYTYAARVRPYKADNSAALLRFNVQLSRAMLADPSKPIASLMDLVENVRTTIEADSAAGVFRTAGGMEVKYVNDQLFFHEDTEMAVVQFELSVAGFA